MLLTEQEIKDAVGFTTDQMTAYRRVESTVLEKLKAQVPVVFWLCDGCGHYYQECEDGQRPVSSCDCMTEASMFRKEFYQLPPADVVRDARIAELEAVLRECREAMIPYMKYVDGTNVLNHPAQCVAKIDEVLHEDR